MELAALRLTSTLLPGLTQFRCPARVGALLGFFASLLAASGLEAILNRERLAGGRWARPALLLVGLLALYAAALAFARGPEQLLRLRPGLPPRAFWPRRALGGGEPGCRGGRLGARPALPVGGRGPPDRRGVSRPLHLPGEADPPRGAGRRLGGTIPTPPTPGRFAVAPADHDSLRYSPLVSLLGEGPLSGVVTNEGGVLPASLERLHAGLIDPVTRDTVMRLAACDLLYDTERRTWVRLTDGLGRVRLAGELDLRQLHAEGRFLDLSPGAGSVEVLRETPQHMVLKARADRPSLLIVADCYYPGWGARVDGRAVPVERVHGSFRAVVVPAGDHRVEMAYAPSSFRWGVAGTIAGLLLLALLALQVPPPEG